jgi:putative transferase (TIGR04331 family)
MFWNPKHWEVKPEAKPFFDRLKDAGIFHETPQSAARHISIIWDDVSAWWAREDVQCARRSFCDNYAASANNIVDRIRNALINEAQLAENLLSR